MVVGQPCINLPGDDPPPAIRDGGMVRRGVSAELDEALDMAENGRQYIANYEASERERTGIPTLRIRFNRVFGYTIEVTRSQAGRVPDDYQRRQTLAGAERYTTPPLQRLEDQVATADERSKELQLERFETWRGFVLDARESFQALADALADIDVLATFAEIAATHGIDVLFIGTSDLSFSLGLRGQQDHPQLEAAVARIVSAAQRHGKHIGRPLREPRQLASYRDQGFAFFQAPTDLDFLAAGAREFLSGR